MLAMKRMQEADKKVLLDMLGIVNEEAFVFEATERGERIGYAVFEHMTDRVVLTHAEYGTDGALLDGLVRAGMAYLEDSGNTALYFGEMLDQRVLKQYGFITDDKNYVDSVGEFLKTCKKCRM